MKKITYISILLFFTYTSEAKIIRVGKGQAIKTIQQALSIAANGDSVLVEAGNYHEKNIVISKTIFFIGVNRPVLDGDHQYEVISVKADGVVVEGFKIIHSGVSSIEDFAGIKIYNARDVIIRNNILEDTFFGIYAQY